MSAPAGNPDAKGKQPRRVCERCAKSKLFCDKNYPCHRCLHLGLECHPALCKLQAVTIGNRKRKRESKKAEGTRSSTICCGAAPLPVPNISDQTTEDVLQGPLILAFIRHSTRSFASGSSGSLVAQAGPSDDVRYNETNELPKVPPSQSLA